MASLGWVSQLLVRLGLLDVPDPKSAYYNPEKVTKLHIDGIASWDEIHHKVNPGGGVAAGTKDSVVQFHCDKNGKINFVNGEYSTDKVTQMRCKYTDEGRLSLGAAMVTPLDDNGDPLPVEGQVAKPFVYSCKTLLSINDCSKKTYDEFRRVQNLKSGRE